MDTSSDFQPLPALVRIGDLLVAERRRTERELFAAVQQVRPVMYDGTRSRSRFVRCHDLTEQGISFWSSESYLTDRLVITLENDDAQYELPLEICHQTAITCLHDPLYLVGCQFQRSA